MASVKCWPNIYIFSEDTAQCHRLWYNAVVACAREQTHSACTPRFPSPKRKMLPRHVRFFVAGGTVIKSVGFHVFKTWFRFGPGSDSDTSLGVQITPWGFFRFWANLALYGRLLINEATGHVGGYGLGKLLTKHIFFSEDTAPCHRLWYNAVVACASEQTHPACTPRFISLKR